MCTSRNKRKHAIWSRLPCPLQKILLLHRSQFHQEGRILIFHKTFGLKQRRTFLADTTEQRLVNVLKFICNNSQWTIDSSKWKKSGSPWLLFQANRLTLCYGSPQAKVTRRVEWDIASGALKTQRAVQRQDSCDAIFGFTHQSASTESLFISLFVLPCNRQFPVMTLLSIETIGKIVYNFVIATLPKHSQRDCFR